MSSHIITSSSQRLSDHPLRIRITHIDAPRFETIKLPAGGTVTVDKTFPNIALMKLSQWHKDRGDDVTFSYDLGRNLFDQFDVVYGSCVFSKHQDRLASFLKQWPEAIVGGTGTTSKHTVEMLTAMEVNSYDYSIYPDFNHSLGFSMRGCRFNCGFCVVPAKEGRAQPVSSLTALWRGPESDNRNILLMDNDFFGQNNRNWRTTGQEHPWREKLQEAIDHNYNICLNQGINLRILQPEQAEMLAEVRPQDKNFKETRIYTAWDNLEDESLFFQGVHRLADAGVNATRLSAYMLIGHALGESDSDILYRYHRMKDAGIRAFPMPFEQSGKPQNPMNKRFQRWAVLRLEDKGISWKEYKSQGEHHYFRRTRNIKQVDMTTAGRVYCACCGNKTSHTYTPNYQTGYSCDTKCKVCGVNGFFVSDVAIPSNPSYLFLALKHSELNDSCLTYGEGYDSDDDLLNRHNSWASKNNAPLTDPFEQT